MAYVNMQVAPALEGGADSKAFEYSESLAAAGSSADVLIPNDVQGVVVSAEGAGGATVIVYSTVDPVSVVKAGVGVTWLAWGAGAISTATGTTFAPVTAIKMVQSGSGTSKLSMRSQ